MKISDAARRRTRLPISQDEARRLFRYLESGTYVFESFKQYRGKLLIRDTVVGIDKIFDVPEPGYVYTTLSLYYEDGLPYLHRSNSPFTSKSITSLAETHVYDYNRDDLPLLLPVARDLYRLHCLWSSDLEDYADHISSRDLHKKYDWSTLARIRTYLKNWLNGNSIIPIVCKASVRIIRGKLVLTTDHRLLRETVPLFGEYRHLEDRKCLLEIVYSKDREKCKVLISEYDQTDKIHDLVKQLRVLV